MEETFLMKNRETFIKKTRSPVTLADALLQNECITNEMYDTINGKKTNQDKTRAIFSFLNCPPYFVCAFNWFKKNESALIEELRKGDNVQQGCSEEEAPQKKRTRRETQGTMDEADNTPTIFPDLNIISTFPKLEKWLSEPDNSQRLIAYLEEKIGEKNLQMLKEELKGRKPKTSLCFNARNIDDIRKNGEIETFLNTKRGANFPKLILSMFFKKRSSASSGKKAQSSSDERENMDTHDLNSIGDGAKENSTQKDDEAPHGVLPDEKENEDKKDVKKTDSDGQPQPSGQTPKEEKTQLPITRGSEDTPEIEAANAHKSTFGAGPSCSNPKAAPETNKKKLQKKKGNKLEEKNQITTSLLRDWAARQDGGIKNTMNQISIINKAEHPDYPFFTAENIRLYKNPTTDESQILFITAEKTTSATKATLQYLMFVCDVKNAVLLCPEEPNEQQIIYVGHKCFIDKCLRFIGEALAPTLALFKKIQKEELDSLICG